MNCLLCGNITDREFLLSEFLFFFSRPKEVICPACAAAFEKIAEQHCPSCAKSGEKEACQDCHYWNQKGETVDHQALYIYNEAMKDYFSRYKFFGDYVLAELFAKDLKVALSAYEGYAIVPVPVSPKTLEERGFNQVAAMLDKADVPYQELLTKADGDKQSSKTREERLLSCPNYALLTDAELPKKILLVDDIYTTGATISSIKRLLLEHGVEEVKSFSLAR